ncbi:MAG: DUF1667 domain-containing protein, partial [Acetanaerobacterium sp.]
NPTRVVTSTVRIEGAAHRRMPVKTDADIPKGLIMDAMGLLRGITVQAPVKTGDIIAEHILGLSVNFVATRDMPSR